MFKDKYPSIFLKSNGSYCVRYPSNIFRSTRNLKIGKYHSDIPQFYQGDIQSCVSLRPIACERKYLTYFTITTIKKTKILRKLRSTAV